MRINPSKIIECLCHLKKVNNSVKLVKNREIKIFGIKIQGKDEYLIYKDFPSIKVTHTYHEAGACYYEPHVDIITDAGLRTVWFNNPKDCQDYYNEISINFLKLYE